MKIAVIGATGFVGRAILSILEKNLNLSADSGNQIIPVASGRSINEKKSVPIAPFGSVQVVSCEDAIKEDPAFVLMSAPESVSKKWAPRFAENKAFVIDNSPAWRTNEEIPLVIPGITKWECDATKPVIIASPNCVATMLATAIYPLFRFGIDHVSASVFQAVSGSGMRGLIALEEESRKSAYYPHSPFVGQIFGNIIPASGREKDPLDPKRISSWNTEEEKVMREMPKILGSQLKISPTCLRVPIPYGHSAAVRVTFKKAFDSATIKQAFLDGSNIKIEDEPSPIHSVGHDYASVGRIRIDPYDKHVLEFFVSSDNLRLGAASNVVSIMDEVVKKVYTEALK